MPVRTGAASPGAGALDGISIVDCGSWIAAPSAAALCASFGATVTKVEPTGAGDPVRRLSRLPGMPVADTDYAWAIVGASKQNVALDLKKDEGREFLNRLVGGADVFVTNTPLDQRTGIGVDFESISQVNKRIVYLSVTAYGETGPDRALSGFDNLALWGRSGMMDQLRPVGGTPMRTVPAAGDFATGVSAFAAILLGLRQRDTTDEAVYVSTSLLGNGLWANAINVQAALAGADVSNLIHRLDSPASMNHVSYVAGDGVRVQFGLFRSPAVKEECFKAIGIPGVEQQSVANQINALEAAIPRRPSAEWLTILRPLGAIIDRVQTIEMLATDEQVLADHVGPTTDGEPKLLPPMRIQGTPPLAGVASPVGRNTMDIAGELGYTADEIQRLVEAGVLATES